MVDGFAVDQLTHCLQTATLAERAGADDELVVASLCHDIGKAVSVPNHPRIAAEILRPVRARRGALGDRGAPGLPGAALLPPPRRRPARHGRSTAVTRRSTFAERFADEWDQIAFDPAYDTLPLEHFEPLVREVFANPSMF